MKKDNTSQPEAFESFDEFFTQAEKDPQYWIEKAKLEFTEKILARMEELNLKKGELAEKLGAKPGFITRILSGTNNFELATMVKIAMALGCEFRSHLQPSGTTVEWFNFLNEEPESNSLSDWKVDDFERIKTRNLNDYESLSFNP